jgi:hypothetical protein
VGLAPTGKRRLLTAQVEKRLFLDQGRQARISDPILPGANRLPPVIHDIQMALVAVRHTALLRGDLRRSVESDALPGHAQQVVGQPPDTTFYKTFQVQLMHSVQGRMPKLGQPALEKSTAEESMLA